MPQFDFHTFSVQIFWTLSGFFIFYFSILKNFLSNLAALFKLRSKVLSGFNTGSEQKPIALLDFFFRNIRN
jgi:hypothetical protein